MKILVTGGAGFIGSAVIRLLISETSHQIINLDKLTYASNLTSLDSVSSNPRYQFIKGDITDQELLSKIFSQFQPDIIMHLAAESHVDRSIENPSDFITTNIVGTSTLLEVARSYWCNLPENKKSQFRFHHISTDEVYGSLSEKGLFTETSPYDPSSPYSASKASSDHLVRAWHKTFGLPVLITNCSNNYGSFQFPEKFVPLILFNAIKGEPIPIYGDGQQIRDWLYVDDHARALLAVVTRGVVGETYNIGGHNELTNLTVAHTICDLLDEMRPNFLKKISSYRNLITFVNDRLGHDERYAIDASKIKKELSWIPEESFNTGIRKTILWYLENELWCESVLEK